MVLADLIILFSTLMPIATSVKGEARDYFTRLTGLFKNFDYAADNSPDYRDLLRQVDELVAMAPR